MNKLDKIIKENPNANNFKAVVSDYFVKDLHAKGTLTKENLRDFIKNFIGYGIEWAKKYPIVDYSNKEFENALFYFLYENGLYIGSGESNKIIEVDKGDEDWTVSDYFETTGKSYKTLKNAVKECNNN